jgi:hypothetical protein
MGSLFLFATDGADAEVAVFFPMPPAELVDVVRLGSRSAFAAGNQSKGSKRDNRFGESRKVWHVLRPFFPSRYAWKKRFAILRAQASPFRSYPLQTKRRSRSSSP